MHEEHIPPLVSNVETVIHRLVEHISNKKLQAGDCLPPVRDLAKQWRLGPTNVRDGLLRAQTLGLVEIRARSGVIVRSVDYASLVSTLLPTLSIAVHEHDPGLVHLWHARATIEVENARVAARRRLPEDLQELRRLLEQMEEYRADRPKFVEADEQFHLAIARTAGNPVLQMLLDLLLKILRPEKLSATSPPAEMKNTFADHLAIYNSIGEGNPAKAGEAMSTHCRRRMTRFTQASPTR